MGLILEPLTLFSAPAHADLTYPSCARLFGHLSVGESSRLVGTTANCDGEPAGLILSWRGVPTAALLMSLVVKEPYRRRGIAARLLDEHLATLTRLDCRAVGTTLERGRPWRDIVERMLAARGFAAPVPRALMCRVDDGGVLLRQAPWWNKSLLPSGFTMFPWTQLTDTDRRAIIERQEREHWYPDNLDPFIEEKIVEPLNSLGLRDASGAVAGWMVTHRPLPDLVRYTYLFVREDLQRFGLAVPLLIESMRLHVFSPNVHDIPKATFKIPLQYESMTRFARTRMAPFLNELNEIVDTAKDLA